MTREPWATPAEAFLGGIASGLLIAAVWLALVGV